MHYPGRVRLSREVDEFFMHRALDEAKYALEEQEVPVGAVIVRDGVVVASAHNMVESLGRATAHAEMLAIDEASRRLGDWRLDGCTIYVTCEPCQMCMGAIFYSRISRVVYGADQPRSGACGSFDSMHLKNPLNRGIEVEVGVCEGESKALLRDFFKLVRSKGSTELENII